MKIVHAIVLASSALMLSGCATLFGGGSSQTINLVPSDGKPHAVSVQANNQAAYTINIPTSIPVDRSHKDITIVVKDSVDGTLAPTVVESKMNSWFMGDIVALSLLSSSIDCISGAAWKYDENVTVNVTKEAVEAAEAKKAEEKAKKQAVSE